MTSASSASAPVGLRAVGPRQLVAGALVLGGLVVLVLLPQYFLLSSEQRTLAGVFMFVALAQGWNLIGGFAGYPSFGNVVFFGLGGYTTAVLMAKSGVPFWVALPISALVGVAFAVLVVRPAGLLGKPYYEARVEV